jgi:hypothetical protein
MIKFQIVGNLTGESVGIQDSEGRVWNPAAKAFEATPPAGTETRIPLVPHPHSQYGTVFRVVLPDVPTPPNGVVYTGYIFAPGADVPYDGFVIGRGENFGTEKIVVINVS